MNSIYDYTGHVITIVAGGNKHYCTILQQEARYDYVIWNVFIHETRSIMSYVHMISKCFKEDYISGISYINGCSCIHSLITFDRFFQ